MSYKQIERYLVKMKTNLWWQGLADAGTLEELESHLNEAVEEGMKRGLDPEEAQAQALTRFGPASQVAEQFGKERMAPMQKILLILAAAGGITFAVIDALPKFDDMGILAFSILIFSGLLSLVGFRKPWLLALAVGLWIPLHDILSSANFGSLLALLFALAGAYGGWGIHRLVRKTLIEKA